MQEVEIEEANILLFSVIDSNSVASKRYIAVSLIDEILTGGQYNNN